jgi:hypothetical protein
MRANRGLNDNRMVMVAYGEVKMAAELRGSRIGVGHAQVGVASGPILVSERAFLAAVTGMRHRRTQSGAHR